jgi:hypothetical protein
MRTSLVVVCLALVLGSCGLRSTAGPMPGSTASAAPRFFDGERALARVGEQLAFGDRSPGSAGHAAVQAWIKDELGAAGWSAQAQSFSYHGQQLLNLTGSSADAGSPYLILGAHYDNRPLADQASVSQPGPVPGANDGGSGVAVLLGLADVMRPEQLGCRLELAFFDGEDSGGLDNWDWVVGSTYMAEHLDQPPDGVVVVDMVGDKDLQLFYERNSDPDMRQAIWEVASSLGYAAFIPRQKYSMIDDHTPFLNQGIPAVDIIDFDYPYWHTPQDTLDKVSASSLESVGRTLQAWLTDRCG